MIKSVSISRTHMIYEKLYHSKHNNFSRYYYEHGNSLPSHVSLMVGKRVLQGYVWECRENRAIDPDLGDKLVDQFGDFGDEMWDLKSTGIFLISLLEAEIWIYPDDSM
ncbi:hypothetical protein AVEN_365-1 [Araneus ventricosus]|uniref:Uncharacterized protein n=1 Tax=Araneus ventricosus TaxID=182803 RepID=A0A4Y2DRW2_ARAVE|nr:hypothetical protein AVEN_365-1 [Araneus ventricosus]